MLCPNCGTQTTTEHKFCRGCGMNLEPVARALAAHLSHGGAAAARAAREAERRAALRMTKGLVTGAVFVLTGLLLMALLPGKGFKLIGIATALVGIVAALVSVFSPLRSMAGRDAAPAPPAPDAAAPPTRRLLREESFEPVPSITERTTDLLGAEVEGRKPRG